MEYRVRVNLFWAAAVLSLGIAASIITSTVVVSRSLDNRLKKQVERSQDITVKGSARTRVKSDTAVWQITVQGEAKELKEAFAVLDAGATRLRAFLQAQGFKDSEIGTAAIMTSTYYVRDANNNMTREVLSYALSRTFTVSTADVLAVATAAGEVTQLIKEGIAVTSYMPQYSYSKIADLKVQILGEASRDARSRADEIIRNSGGSIGTIRDARMSPLQITRPDSTDVSAEGRYDTTTIEKDVTAVVTMTFGVNS